MVYLKPTPSYLSFIFLLSIATLRCSDKQAILAEVSLGELVDKITILKIKRSKITNQTKLAHVLTELATLKQTYKSAVTADPELKALVEELKEINLKLWHIEDAIREKEYKKEFDSEFIGLARAVYVTNDKRFELKQKINAKLGSKLVEVKEHIQY